MRPCIMGFRPLAIIPTLAIGNSRGDGVVPTTSGDLVAIGPSIS